jgi:hypothetical protein
MLKQKPNPWQIGNVLSLHAGFRPSGIRGLSTTAIVASVQLGKANSYYQVLAINDARITQSLIAVLAGMRLPFLCIDTHERDEEIVASYL